MLYRRRILGVGGPGKSVTDTHTHTRTSVYYIQQINFFQRLNTFRLVSDFLCYFSLFLLFSFLYLIIMQSKMRLVIVDNYDKVSEWAAKYVRNSILKFNPGPDHYFVLGLPTGLLERMICFVLCSLMQFNQFNNKERYTQVITDQCTTVKSCLVQNWLDVTTIASVAFQIVQF